MFIAILIKIGFEILLFVIKKLNSMPFGSSKSKPVEDIVDKEIKVVDDKEIDDDDIIELIKENKVTMDKVYTLLVHSKLSDNGEKLRRK